MWTHPDISFRFRPGGRRLKKFRFSRIWMSAREFFLSAFCGLNFDATDLPNSYFELLYPKLFRGTPEVDLVSTVWPPDLPKLRWCPYLSAYSRSYIFGKLWHLAIIWAIRKAFQCILQGVRILLAKYTRISPTSDNESYSILSSKLTFKSWISTSEKRGPSCPNWGHGGGVR